MKRRLWFIALTGLFLLLPQRGFAHTKQYLFNFSGAAESPPVASAGIGYGTATFDLDLVTMRVQAVFSGLTGNTSAAHIHCCDFNVAGNAGVATEAPSFTGFPLGVKNGTMDHTFDMSLAGSYRAQFLTANGGSVANALQSLLNGLDSGQAYFNIHSSSFGSGEIRGQAVTIPEPTAAGLGILAIGIPALLRRHRSI